MLTKRENLLETIRGGNPDRFVNQYEPFGFIMANPIMMASPFPAPGTSVVNSWGVTIQYAENTPGPFPVHDDEHKVVKDVTKWKDVVRAPKTDYPDEAWTPFVEQASAVDRNDKFATIMMFPGVFEQLHYLMGMDDCLLNFYTESDAMKELIAYITEFEIRYAEQLIKHFKPEVTFHHDDWGSQISSFMSPEMFDEFLVPAYKEIYGFHKANGVDLIVHHSDSYAANLVPAMIEVGIDIFQGCITTNNVPQLIKDFGGKISFMGDLNNGVIDVPNWTPELISREVKRACTNCGRHYFIPCLTAGGPGSTYPGVYDAVSAEIDRINKEGL